MPSSVLSIFAAAGLRPLGVTAWGGEVPEDEPGVYVVALDEDPEALTAHLPEAPIADGAIEHLLKVRPELQVDDRPPTPSGLRARLQQFWLPDETILYIGLASRSIRSRVDAYYRTKLGARSPHAGGWFLKTLERHPTRYVHWATTENPLKTEDAMLRAFCDGVSDSTRATLYDPARPFPFANLEWPPGTRKRHGIKGAKAARRTPTRPSLPEVARSSGASTRERTTSVSRGPVGGSSRSVEPVAEPTPSIPTPRAQSQNVTEADLRSNQIRFPSRQDLLSFDEAACQPPRSRPVARRIVGSSHRARS